MDTIDLHGTRHDDVKWKLIKKIESLWDTSTELTIITGHSQVMKDIVVNILEEYGLDYTIGDYFGMNDGFIKVIV